MALMDMIHEVLTPAQEQHQDETQTPEYIAAMESLTDYHELPTPEPVEIRAINPLDALAAIEAHMEMRDGPAEPAYYDALHAALEANLPTEAPPYDPTAELEEIAQSLAGIDMDEIDDVDQPQPDADLNDDSTINDIMTTVQDKESRSPDDLGVLNV